MNRLLFRGLSVTPPDSDGDVEFQMCDCHAYLGRDEQLRLATALREWLEQAEPDPTPAPT